MRKCREEIVLPQEMPLLKRLLCSIVSGTPLHGSGRMVGESGGTITPNQTTEQSEEGSPSQTQQKEDDKQDQHHPMARSLEMV